MRNAANKKTKVLHVACAYHRLEHAKRAAMGLDVETNNLVSHRRHHLVKDRLNRLVLLLLVAIAITLALLLIAASFLLLSFGLFSAIRRRLAVFVLFA
eukprot:6173127-Pleurochrysis_carterae.AAC.2